MKVEGAETDYRRCRPCSGTGYYGMDPKSTCKTCGGLGITGNLVPTVRVVAGIAGPSSRAAGFTDTELRPLLQLPNRDALFGNLTELVATGAPVGVLFIDLDGFKNVNDTCGHAAGDTCLEQVALLLGRILLGRGRLYRYGGDEFVLVMPNTAAGEATATGERVRLEIERSNVGGSVALTASVGVVATDMTGLTGVKELVEGADRAVYASKKGGKNRVTCAPPSDAVIR